MQKSERNDSARQNGNADESDLSPSWYAGRSFCSISMGGFVAASMVHTFGFLTLRSMDRVFFLTAELVAWRLPVNAGVASLAGAKGNW